MSQRVILVTGSRKVDLDEAQSRAGLLLRAELTIWAPGSLSVVHGGADGWDLAFHHKAKELGVTSVAYQVNDPRFNPRCYTTPLERNQFMVTSVAYWRDKYAMNVVCWTFADKWASGTGHCARRARHAGIDVVDYGVYTGK
jgi:hypothetical protein